jgi:type IV secretion system protein VirD4
MAAIAVSMTRTKNFMAGKEHGVSEWGKPSELTDKFQSERPEKNRILSQNVRIDINDRSTRMNNNIYILGGSGTGKTQFVIAPNLLQHNTSILVTDPSGEILNVYGNDLEAAGYEIRVLNTVDLSKCHGYNPFRYLKNAEDVDQLITMIMANTTAKGQQSSDPFWEKSERMLVKGIMLYVYMEVPYAKRNLVTVIDCLSGIRVVSNKPYYHTGFGSKIRQLPAHPARILYERVMEGAEDTVRSILITALSRFSMFDNNKELERILSTDEMEMDEFGTGYHGNPERKMALFCITPDNGDKTYNFLVGMLYSQFFSRQYYVGDTFYGNRLPVPIMCWFDELANIALPEGFTDLLSTVRKRNIGIAMIFQDIAKTKKVFKDEWESLIGNADTFIYLGGNEPGSQKYVSERLGQMTLYTRSEGRSYGQHASSSTNVSSLGRPLIYASEIDNMSPEQCIIKLKGQAPIMDYKYKTFQSDAYKKAISFGEYVIRIRKRKPTEIQTSMISSEALEHYRIMGEKDARYRPVVVHPELLFGQKEKSETLDVEDLRAASQAYRQRMAAQEALKVANKAKEKSMLDRVLLLSPDQAEEVRLALEHGLSEEDVQTIFNPSLSAEQMRLIRTMKETSNAQ